MKLFSNSSTSSITPGKDEFYPSIKSKLTAISSLIFLTYTPLTSTTAWSTSLPPWNNKPFKLTKTSSMISSKNLNIFSPLSPTMAHFSSQHQSKPSKPAMCVPPKSGKSMSKSSRNNWQTTPFCEWVSSKRCTRIYKTKMLHFSPKTKIKCFFSSSM